MQNDDQSWEHEDGEDMTGPQVTEQFLPGIIDLPWFSSHVCTLGWWKHIMLLCAFCFREEGIAWGESSQVTASWNGNTPQGSVSALVLA